MMNRQQLYCVVVLTAAVFATGAQQVQTQPQAPAAYPAAQAANPQPQSSGDRWSGPMDEDRARQLYVSNDHADHARGVDFAAQVQEKAAEDRRLAEVSKGV